MDFTDAVAVKSSFNQYDMLYGGWFYGYLHAKLGNLLNYEKLGLCQKAWLIKYNNTALRPTVRPSFNEQDNGCVRVNNINFIYLL